jgi:FMN reductase (NADPH)
MIDNPIINAMMNRKSIRKYKPDMPSNEVIETIVRAGLQAPFASQLCSVLLSRDCENTEYNAPLSFIMCMDFHKMEMIMGKRKWKSITSDLWILLLGFQDVSLMGENMVITAESLGLGSCYLGMVPYTAKKIARKFKLPKRIFPLVELIMGYPDEDPPPRPRYPLDFVLFEDEYTQFSNEQIDKAMKVMDDGFMAQDYYSKDKLKLGLPPGREETYDFSNYSWTEHISRKWGQWFASPEKLLEQFKACGFNICAEK